jgi:hypothetical protein
LAYYLEAWHDGGSSTVAVHREVLARSAWAPYQYHGYIPAVVSEWAHRRIGLSLAAAYTAWAGVGYLLVLAASWLLFRQAAMGPGQAALGLYVVTCYAYFMMRHAGHHHSDTYGAALFALSLALLARGKAVPLLVVSALAGFLWTKQVFIGPIALLFCWVRGDRLRGALLGAAAFGCAAAGPALLVWLLGYRPNVPVGTLEPADFVASLAKSVPVHLLLAAPPLLSLRLLQGRAPLIVRVGAWVYPMMLAAYAAQRLWLWEARSWWIVVPVFAAAVASWCVDDHDGEVRRDRPSEHIHVRSGERGEGQGEASCGL